jgi:hypothetical protein
VERFPEEVWYWCSLNLIGNQSGRRIVALVGGPLHMAILMNGLAVFIGSQISP